MWRWCLSLRPFHRGVNDNGLWRSRNDTARALILSSLSQLAAFRSLLAPTITAPCANFNSSSSSSSSSANSTGANDCKEGRSAPATTDAVEPGHLKSDSTGDMAQSGNSSCAPWRHRRLAMQASSSAAENHKAIGRHHRDIAPHAPAEAPASASSSQPVPTEPGLMAVFGAMAGLFRGMSGTSLGHAIFGLQALTRQHEQGRVRDHPEGGVPLPDGPTGLQAEASRLVELLEFAHGAYRNSAGALAAMTCLRAQHVHVWRPEAGRLQPGYYVAVDYPGRRVVWGLRGTQEFADILTDLALAAHPLGVGEAHWGMTHAAHWVLQQEAQRVGDLLRSLRPAGEFRLQLVGHSLGGGVAALAAVMLREGLVEAARSAAIPPEAVSCIAFAPPAVMSAPLAALCRPYVTSVVLDRDIVPRFNAGSLALLQEELKGVDWYGELQRTLLDHSMVKSLSSTFGALAPSTPATTTPATPTDASSSQPASQPCTSSVAGSLASALQPPAAVQQLSAAVLESGAFRSAVTALDEWKAKAMTATGGDQAEAVIARQSEILRAWLQDMANITQGACGGAAAGATEGADAGAAEAGKAGAQVVDVKGEAKGDAGWMCVPTSVPGMDEMKRAAEAAAERLRSSVDTAVASVTAAAVASKDKLSATLPSLPQPHELPLVEPTAVAATATATAAAAAADAAVDAGATPRLKSVESAVRQGVEGASSDGGGSELEEQTALAKAIGKEAPQEIPLFLLPGRIFYMRPLDDAADFEEGLPASDGPHGAIGRRHGNNKKMLNGTGTPPFSSAAAGSGKAPGPEYTIEELPSGTSFQRVILGEAALTEHKCRAYRRVLMQLAQQVRAEQ